MQMKFSLPTYVSLNNPAAITLIKKYCPTLKNVFPVIDSHQAGGEKCPWSALDCSDGGMTWSLLVYLEDQNQLQVIVYSADTASIFINADGNLL